MNSSSGGAETAMHAVLIVVTIFAISQRSPRWPWGTESSLQTSMPPRRTSTCCPSQHNRPTGHHPGGFASRLSSHGCLVVFIFARAASRCDGVSPRRSRWTRSIRGFVIAPFRLIMRGFAFSETNPNGQDIVLPIGMEMVEVQSVAELDLATEKCLDTTRRTTTGRHLAVAMHESAPTGAQKRGPARGVRPEPYERTWNV